MNVFGQSIKCRINWARVWVKSTQLTYYNELKSQERHVKLTETSKIEKQNNGSRIASTCHEKLVTENNKVTDREHVSLQARLGHRLGLGALMLCTVLCKCACVGMDYKFDLI